MLNGGGYQLSLAAQIAKQFEIGDTATFDFRSGYAYSDSVVGNAGGSSTAGSNFEEVATKNFNSAVLGTSPNNNKHNITVNLTYSDEWFGDDLRSSISAFFRARSGRPLTLVYDANTDRDTFGDSDAEARSLLYIPTGESDPLVNFAEGFDTAGFFQFIREQGLEDQMGQIIDRSSLEQPWSTDIDLKFTQEIPGFTSTDKFELSIDFENVLNFFNNSWGRQNYIRPGDVGEAVPVLGATISDGVYTYSGFNADTVFRTQTDVEDTLWRIQVGLKYRF